MNYATLIFSYTFTSILFLIYSYGFVDKNLTELSNPIQYLVFERRGWAGGVYVGFFVVFWLLYYALLRLIDQKKISFDKLKTLIIATSAIFLFSFPAFSYDIFNYMLTARVAFTHKENPWVVRPIEIPNEPALAYTRAANKWALYGPTWILLTYVPHVFGLHNVWLTIIMFKLLIYVFFYFFLFLVWKQTKNIWNVAFFAFNPLVLITILNEAHNDIVMMVLVVSSLLFTRYKFWLWIASVFVKGATIVLLPVTSFRVAYWLMFLVFLVSPFREEMYPWYFIWCLSLLAFLPKSHRFIYKFSLAFCFGLLLRNLPYIVTRQYDGYNQLIRTAVTWLPLVILAPNVWNYLSKKFRS
jgi:hypothetical protein